MGANPTSITQTQTIILTKMLAHKGYLKEKGFTLIELMIVVVIVAFLTTVALPTYRNFIVRTNRAEAVADLSELASWLERQYTIFGSYNDPSMPVLPFSTTPRSGNTKYNITLTSTTPSTYLLTSSPIGGQLTDDTNCGILTLSNTSKKCILVGSGSVCSDDTSSSQRDQVGRCFKGR